MKGTVFRSTALEGTVMRNTALRGNVLRGAVLRGNVLRDTVLRGNVLRGTVLRGITQTKGKLITDGTIYGKAICENFIITGTVIKPLALFGKQCVLTRFGFRQLTRMIIMSTKI